MAAVHRLKTVGDPLGTGEVGCFFTSKSDLVLPFHATTDALKKDGFLDHLDTRWFFLYDYDPPAK